MRRHLHGDRPADGRNRRRTSHRHAAVVAAVCTAIVVTLSACTNDLDPAASSTRSDPRPTTTVPGFPPGSLPQDTIPPDTIPQDPFATTTTLVPDPETLRECAELAAAYSEIIALAYAGDPDGRLDELFDRLEGVAPQDLQDDLTIVRETVTDAAGDGILDTTGALLSEEFTAANEALVTWLSANCTG